MGDVSGNSGRKDSAACGRLQEQIVALVAVRRPAGTLLQQRYDPTAVDATGAQRFQDGHNQSSSGRSQVRMGRLFQQPEQLRDQIAVDRLLDKLFRAVR